MRHLTTKEGITVPKFDLCDRAEQAIADFIAARVHELRALPPSTTDYPGDVQAAQLLIGCVLSNVNAPFRSDRFYALAVDLADSIDANRWQTTWPGEDWSDLSEVLREWTADVEQDANVNE